jgi:hypothetical protein
MAKKQNNPSPSTASSRTGESASSGERTIVVTFQGDVRVWQTHWQTLLAAHSTWWARTPQAEPVYWLPKPVVDQLSRKVPSTDKAHRGHPALLDPSEAAAENAFRECCLRYSPSVVGVWHGCPVIYEPLASSSPITISEEQRRDLGWADFGSLQALNAGAEAVQRKAEVARHEQLAFAGWLTFNRSYQKEKNDLATRCANLGISLPWPLLANTADQEPIPMPSPKVRSCEPLPPQAAAFLEEFTKFSRKWYVNRLVTWDLPLPQGPLEQIPIGLACRILGPNTISSFYPAYFDIPSSQDVRGEIREQQEAAGKQAGIDADFPLTDLSARAGDHASAWENSFRLWFIEQAALQRYSGRRGLTARLLEGFMEEFHCSSDRVEQLRGLSKGNKPVKRKKAKRPGRSS